MSNEKRILIAFDSSEGTFKAVDYTGEMVGLLADVAVTLLFVERLPDRDMFENESGWIAECTRLTELYGERLALARAKLVQHGIAATRISEKYLVSCQSPFADVKVCSTGMSIVNDILAFQKEGNFGTVVVARRGVSRNEAFLFGSVSSRIVQESEDITVWVVG